MIKKDKRIIKFINLVNNVFGKDKLVISDNWDMDLCATGLQKNNKLIYVSTTGCKRDHYFYECEILVDDLDMPYIVQDSGDNVHEKRLLEVMAKFFEIEIKSKT